MLNEGPVWELDEESYRITVDDEGGSGLVKEPTQFTIKQLREEFEHVEVVAALQVRLCLIPFLPIVYALYAPNPHMLCIDSSSWFRRIA